MISEIEGLVLSDIHLGHSNTPTAHIVKNIQKLLNDRTLLSRLKIIWLSGDVFDHGLDLNDPSVYVIRWWIVELLRVAKQYDILVEVLYGTPSHDKRQSQLFVHLNELCEIGAKVRYVSELSIVYIEELDINVLYVPDRARSSNSLVWRDVKRLLTDRRLDKVDFAIMHGFFDFQVPPIARATTDHHIADDYCDIVKYLIFIGHHHTHNSYRIINVPGSTDRLRHGEEEPKGILHFRVTEQHQEVKFIENVGAMKYCTFEMENETAEEAYQIIKAKVGDDKHAFIRIRAPRESPAFHMGKELENVFPTYRITFDEPKNADKNKVGAIQSVIETATKMNRVSLTKGNLRDELLDRIKESNPALLDLSKKLLNGILHGRE